MYLVQKKKDFSDYVAKDEAIRIADGNELQAKGRGKIVLQIIPSAGKTHSFLLARVTVSTLICGLVSTYQLTRRGMDAAHLNNDCIVSFNGTLVAAAVNHRGQYHLNMTRPTAMLASRRPLDHRHSMMRH